MAYTATRLYRFAEGNKYRECWSITADAASGSFQTGLSVIDAVDGIAPVSMATAAAKFKANLTVGSATANGQVFVSSCASGDVFNVVCIGR